MKNNTKIIYYDFCDLHYSSFYVTGFHQNSDLFQYKFMISKSVPQLLLDLKMGNEYKDILFSICLFKAKALKDEFYFCIDTRDSCESITNKGKGYHLPLLKNVKYYFKANYNRDVIVNNPNLRVFANKIIPVSPFFPVRVPYLLSYLPRIIPCKATGWTIRDAASRIKHLKNLLSLEELREMRNLRKDFDIFFVVGFYHQEIHEEINEFRYQIMKETQTHRNIKFLVGFASNIDIPGKFAELQLQRFPLKEYLRCLAKSKIGIYVRGIHECFSFKFGQLLALGLPIVGQTIRNNKENIMNNKYFDVQFAYESPQEIVQKAMELLDNPDELKIIGESNSKIFDLKFTPKAVVADILQHLMS